MNILYPAIFTAAPEGGYTVAFPDLPEAITEGDTLDEARFNAIEVLTLTLDARMEEAMKIPAPSTPKRPHGQVFFIAPDAKTQAAVLMRHARGGRPVATVAAALGTSWAAAQRLENPRHWPSLRQLEHAAAAVGKRLVLALE